MKNFIKLVMIVVFILGILYSSCKKQELIEDNNLTEVSVDLAKEVAIDYSKVVFENKKDYIPEIKNVIMYTDDMGEPNLYLINYVSNGYIVVSATKKVMPVLAFSDHGNIDDTSKINDNLKYWFKQTNEGVEISKDDESLEDIWYGYLPLPDDDNDDGDEEEEYQIIDKVSPLLQTSWGQGCGYNLYCPTSTNYTFCNHCPTGCVTTAMAQIMKYHSYPNSFDWSAMPNNTWSNETAILMYRIGDFINIEYKTEGSVLNTIEIEENVPSSFINDFNYSSAIFQNYSISDFHIIENELNNSRPVLFGGGNDDNNGHVWVVDGYQRLVTGIYTLFYFHMNWGDEDEDGSWCTLNNFNEYNNKQIIVYNIKP